MMTSDVVVEATSQLGGGAPGRQRILEAAVAVVDERGEAALRVTEIAGTAGVAIGLIHHHFGSREGLVAAVQAVRFAGAAREDLDRIEAIIDSAASPAEFRSAIAAITAGMVDRARARHRLARSAAVGAAHGRPDLREVLSVEAGAMIDRATGMVERAQSGGFVAPGVDARALATFVLSYAFGLVLADLDDRSVDQHVLADIIVRALDAFLVA